MLSPDEWQILALSVRVAIVSVVCSLPVAVLVALVLARLEFPGKTLLDALVHLPLVLPPVVVGYLLLVLFGRRGPIGGWLDREFDVQLVFTTAGAALATAVMSFPLMVRSIRISLETVDRRLARARSTGSRA